MNEQVLGLVENRQASEYFLISVRWRRNYANPVLLLQVSMSPLEVAKVRCQNETKYVDTDKIARLSDLRCCRIVTRIVQDEN